jgi:hypothetical protein
MEELFKKTHKMAALSKMAISGKFFLQKSCNSTVEHFYVFSTVLIHKNNKFLEKKIKMVKNSKWRPTLNMASNRHFFTTKSTVTPSIWTCLNFFLMQFSSFGHQTFFKYKFFLIGNQIWRFHSKWRPKCKKTCFGRQIANFQRIFKNLFAFDLSY